MREKRPFLWFIVSQRDEFCSCVVVFFLCFCFFTKGLNVCSGVKRVYFSIVSYICCYIYMEEAGPQLYGEDSGLQYAEWMHFHSCSGETHMSALTEKPLWHILTCAGLETELISLTELQREKHRAEGGGVGRRGGEKRANSGLCSAVVQVKLPALQMTLGNSVKLI